MSAPTPPRSLGGRIAFLDYLRIFAFASVLIWHKFYGHAGAFIADEGIHATPRAILSYLMPLFEFGGAGVVVFFLVSGYIIAHVLQTERPCEFAVKRAFRIYPLYLVAVITQMLLSGVVPDPLTLIARLLLIGDFFNASYALAGVDWTLRIEVIFYVFMGALRAAGALHRRRAWLPWILVATTLLLGAIPPIPASRELFTGSFTIYSPFLFLGVCFYLRETRQIGLEFLLAFAGLVLFHYYRLIARDEPVVMGAHFATLGLLLFSLAWLARARLAATPAVLFASDLTYAIYLFHSWIWDHLKDALSALSLAILHPDAQALIALLLLCVALVRLVERPGIRLGGRLLARWRRRRSADAA